jgi:hypothetical protein
LDPSDIASSSILHPAEVHESLDWEAINKLCEQNADFGKFLTDVRIDFNSKKIHRAEYDDILDNIEDYVIKALGIAEAT